MRETIYFLYRLLIIRPFCWRKRRRKIDVIRLHVYILNDSSGCSGSLAMDLYESIRHIADHYLISLSKIGIKNFKGESTKDLADLYVTVGESIQRRGSWYEQ